MSNKQNNDSSLAGARCPKCGEVCVYEVSEELARATVSNVQIACHACAHIFKAKLPEDKKLPPLQDTSSHDESIHDYTEVGDSDDLEDIALEQQTIIKAPSRGHFARNRIRYTALAVVSLLTMVITVFAMINTSKDLRNNALAGLEEAPPVLDVLKAAKKAEQKAQLADNDAAPPSSEEQSASNQVSQATPTTSAQFEVIDRGYTISTSNLGTVMNINISVANNGDVAAKPAKMMAHLLSPEGVILMSWPMINQATPSRDLISPKSSRQYSVQLIEPPTNAKTLEVEIQ